jgi:hypothetical protein
MTKRQMIQVELENLNDEDLAEVLGVVKKLAAKKHATGTKPGLLAKLKQVKIEGPEDFAANLDLYLSGEKRIGDDEDLR